MYKGNQKCVCVIDSLKNSFLKHKGGGGGGGGGAGGGGGGGGGMQEPTNNGNLIFIMKNSNSGGFETLETLNIFIFPSI